MEAACNEKPTHGMEILYDATQIRGMRTFNPCL
jgi:hypothetical protein